MFNNSVVFDIEADSLNPTKIHCLSVNQGGTIKTTNCYNNMRKFFSKATLLVGHNIVRYDIPAIERLLDIKIEATLIDTLALSWYLEPKRNVHGLAQWGEEFGIPKPLIDDWEGLTYEEYKHRCEEDVKINTKLWDKFKRHLSLLYGDEDKASKLTDYLTFKMKCASQQEKDRWKLNVPYTTDSLEIMGWDEAHKVNELFDVMPEVPVIAKRNPPKNPFKKDGTLSVAGAKWNNLIVREKLPENFKGTVEEVVGYKKPKPTSPVQVKNMLFDMGWVPETFKYKRDKVTGDVKRIEQINLPDGAGVCPSIKKLFVKEPKLEVLDGLSILTHRTGILRGFLNNVSEDGYVKAEIAGLTNTLRFKHSVVVNLPGVDKPYGEVVRGCLIAPDGYELCGSDMASLEDRTKQSYMYKYDPDYVDEMNVEGFDPHLDIGVLAKMITQEQSDAYKGGDKSLHSVRHQAKQVNYSCTYGITPTGIVRNTGMPIFQAEKLHATYWRRNWALTKIAEACEVKTCKGQKWLYNPVSELWYELRKEKDRFSTLNQGTGTYAFDRWVGYILSKREQITAQFHDEVVLTVKDGNRDKAESLLRWAIDMTNKELMLDRDLDVDVQFGLSYKDIH